MSKPRLSASLRHAVTEGFLLLFIGWSPPVGYAQLPEWRPVWVQLVVWAGLVLPLLWRRRQPEWATVAVTCAAVVQYVFEVWGRGQYNADLALFVMLYTLVSLGRRRWATVYLAVLAAGLLLWWFTWVQGVAWESQDAPAIGWLLFAFGSLLLLTWMLGESAHAREANLALAEQRARQARSEQEALARVAVADERARLARELHDIVAHTVSVMVVHAEGAQLHISTDPPAVSRSLDTISRTGREALHELRRLLEVLHTDDLTRVPQPSMADIQKLVDLARQGGRVIRMSMTGSRDDLTAGASLQIYRIVQEALTNVVKHAAADAEVTVDIDVGTAPRERVIRIKIVNTGGGSRPVDSSRRPVEGDMSGHGLVGMRQRVAMFDGTLNAGPTADGGFQVEATLTVHELPDRAHAADREPAS